MNPQCSFGCHRDRNEAMRSTGKSEVYASVSPKFGPCHAIANGSTRGRRPVMRVTPQKGGTARVLTSRMPIGPRGEMKPSPYHPRSCAYCYKGPLG